MIGNSLYSTGCERNRNRKFREFPLHHFIAGKPRLLRDGNHRIKLICLPNDVFATGRVFHGGLFRATFTAGFPLHPILARANLLPAAEAERSHPVVLGFERFHGGAANPTLDPGRLLLGELNCVSCHQAEKTSAELVQTKQAPILDDVGGRVRVEYLRAFLNDPQLAKPGSTMPNLLAGMPKEERQQKVEALVHFLAMTGSTRDTPADSKKIRPGEKLFREVGCTACHAPGNEETVKGSASIFLGKLSQKYTVASLTRFLHDPLNVRPSARMPAPNLNKNETEEIVSYLLKDLADLPDPELANLPKIPYRYYEGSWSNLPEFDKLKPQVSEIGPAFSPRVARRHNDFGLVFDAWFQAPRTGRYTFEITSDDGSDLWVDGEKVVAADGVHPAQTERRRVRLDQGPHQVRVRYFQGGGEIALEVKIAGPGLPLQHLGPLVAASRDDLNKKLDKEIQEEKSKPRFTIQAELVKQGRELFAGLGCASCHQLQEDRQRIETLADTRKRAKPLAELKTTGGCLTNTAKTGVPFYALNEAQQESLKKAIAQLQEPKAEEDKPEDVIAATMLRYNCYACHERNKIGGVPEARNTLFLTTQQEMGDEGRIPPSLNGVGAKLTRQWLKKIFAEGANDRPYMLTRMPKFGEKNLGHLQNLFENRDTIEPVDVPPLEISDRRVKSLGRMMCGDEVFGCIKCHTFEGQRALGIQSIDMAIMTKRLKHDWFQRYLVNPAAFRPGTRMPSAWPLGRSTLRDVLDGNTQLQIEAIWDYLADGDKARPPQGLNRQAIVLEAKDNAVIYRNFIEGVGPRAIAVAYPEQVNLAFDANEMRLALIWQKQFIDASKHWLGRGSGFQAPLGQQVLAFSQGPAFARLNQANAAWPQATVLLKGYQFRGYKLTPDNRPTFLYDYLGMHVEDFSTGVGGGKLGSTLKRTLTLKQDNNNPVPVYFRAGVGTQIKKIAPKTYRINNDFQVRIQSVAEPFLLQFDGKMELRVPIQWKAGAATVVQEITW